MQCPYCQTENREDRERCYACDKDISMVRLVVNKARQHYNDALEHAERGRVDEAVNELKNALDLDSRFVNAHVVLGTLHAKKGDFDAARHEWQAAIDLDPELAKAHSYLSRIESVERSLPALRTYRFVAAALAALLIACVFLLLTSGGKDDAADRLRQAQAQLESRNYGKALRQLERVRDSATSDSVAYLAAQSLNLALRSDVNQQVRRIDDMTSAGRFADALSAIAELESRQPPEFTRGSLHTIRRQITQFYRQKIDQQFRNFEQSAIQYSELDDEIKQFLRIYPDLPEDERAEIENYLVDARDLEGAKRINALRRKFNEDGDSGAARRGLNELIGTYESLPPKAKRERELLVDDILIETFGQYQQYLDDNKFDEGEVLLASIAEMEAEFKDVTDISGPIDAARRRLEDKRKAFKLAVAEELATAKLFSEARLALLYLVSEPTLSPTEKELIRDIEARLPNSLFSEVADALARDQERFLNLEISDEEASRTLEIVEATLAETKDAAARTPIYAAAVASAVKLDRKEKANEFLERLQKEKSAKPDQLRALQRLAKPGAASAQESGSGASRGRIKKSN